MSPAVGTLSTYANARLICTPGPPPFRFASFSKSSIERSNARSAIASWRYSAASLTFSGFAATACSRSSMSRAAIGACRIAHRTAAIASPRLVLPRTLSVRTGTAGGTAGTRSCRRCRTASRGPAGCCETPQPYDIGAFANLIERVGALAWANRDELDGIDLNPVKIFATSHGCRIIDALIVPAKRTRNQAR